MGILQVYIIRTNFWKVEQEGVVEKSYKIRDFCKCRLRFIEKTSAQTGARKCNFYPFKTDRNDRKNDRRP